MVWLLPVPGGPLMTRLAPERTASMTACWEESASRTRCSRSGSGSGAAAGMALRTALSASGSPASAATTSWSASASPWAARSATIGSLA